jgi:hypothetical protein
MTDTRAVRLFPDWGNSFSLWGGGPLSPRDLGLSSTTTERLAEWTRIWQEVLDPSNGDLPWPDPAVGRAWIVEGEALTLLLRKELHPRPIEASFDMYRPNADGHYV